MGALGPIGFLPASGTFAVLLVGVPLYRATFNWPLLAQMGLLTGWTLAALVVHHFGDRLLGTKDSRLLVWDEIVGFLIATAGLEVFNWRLAITAFVLERALDVAKAPPADRVERRWPGAWGVVGDDVIAGAYTRALLQAMIWIAPGALGVGA